MEAKQTTLQKKQQEDLVQLLIEKEAENKALRKRVGFLESRLEQRSEKTKKDLRKLLPYFKSMRDKVMGIFLELQPTTGLSHKDIIEEFRIKYPMINVAHLPRRVCELVSDEQKLWSKKDEKGTVRFYLKLKDLKGDKSS